MYFSEVAQDGTLVYLQRVHFFGSKCRLDYWDKISFPNKTPVTGPRSRFVNCGSDRCEYMWIIWGEKDRFYDMPDRVAIW